MQSVLVTGARGNTGSALLFDLERRGISAVAGVTRLPEEGELAAAGDLRLCDFEQPQQVRESLLGIEGLYLMVPFHERMLEWAGLVLEEAQRAGVSFILRLSGLAAAPDCGSAMGVLHGRIDEMVKNSGIPWCILRCNSFMQNFSGLYRNMIRQRRELLLPEGGARSAFVDTGDVGAVAGAVFDNPATHAGRVYDLGGPQALDNGQAMAILSEVTGVPMTYRPISDEKAGAAYRKLGLSSWKIEVLQSLGRFIREGNAANVTGLLEELLGRPPTSFHDFAERNRACWN